MEPLLPKSNSLIQKNFQLFFISENKSFRKSKNKIQLKKLTKKYVKDVLLSLIGNEKLSISFSSKFWYFNGFIYRDLTDVITDDKILNMISEVRQFYEMLGNQFLFFDPIMDNIIFLPLNQQKTILEYYLLRVRHENSSLMDSSLKGEFITLDNVQSKENQFSNALNIIMLERYEKIVSVLKTLSGFPHAKRKLITAKLMNYIP